MRTQNIVRPSEGFFLIARHIHRHKSKPMRMFALVLAVLALVAAGIGDTHFVDNFHDAQTVQNVALDVDVIDDHGITGTKGVGHCASGTSCFAALLSVPEHTPADLDREVHPANGNEWITDSSSGGLFRPPRLRA
jgi:hypothetical protein